MRIIPIALCLLTLCGLSACRSDRPAETDKSVKVKTCIASAQAAVAGASYVGQMEAHTSVLVSFETGGNIKSLPLQEGQTVKAGQTAGTIDDTSLRSLHTAALATLRQAKDAHRRYGRLYEAGTVPEVKWVEIESKLQQAQSAEQIARENLGKATCRVPISGVVAARLAEPGMNVAPGQAVAKIVQTQPIYVSVAIPETEIARIKTGDKMTCTVAALGRRSFEATVSEKGAVADPITHTYSVKLLTANADGALMPGMVAEVLPLASAADSLQAIALPAEAVLLADDGRRMVWTVSGGKAHRRFVEVGGMARGRQVVIASGLKEGEEIIIDGMAKVSENSRVEVVK
ncbi:MAG: efflux RND transporter periplasmic adaptor subunit [Alloprevotella sp.]|nr:efflux RND transporter periplasmic adaptor subunit [Alloprevotella sp.]